ncbi:MAG: tripartite tricarboxylate transporter substrate binding protein [Betaproteobacteria bacterium]|nr:tripartite tricarboxylate transporter substrate binding protein [Betaproteobacteria bacterium]MBA3776929.1 tripartite tricarboxylate transporter substrate binding protein [Betaproteobacteria bacterium]
MIRYRHLIPLLPIAAVLVIASLAGPVSAQAWPAKQPIRIISPYAPGGTTDVLARLLAPKLQEKLGQTIIVENRPGAGGNIGTDAVAKAPADGYTLLLAASGPLVIAPSLYPKLPYAPLKDFTYVAPIASAAFVVVVNANAGIDSLKDLITQGKQGKLNFASAGSGTPQHIIGEMFNVRAGTKIQHVPYKGSGPAMNDLLGGQVPVAFENPVPAMPHVKAGKLKVLAVTGASRSLVFPDIPTVAESGLPGFDAKPWYGFLAPANVSPEIVNRLNQAIREASGTPEFKARLAELGAEPMSMSPTEFQGFAKTELDKWTQVVKASGATVD